MLKKIRWSIEFLTAYTLYALIRCMPWKMMRGTAWLLGAAIHLLPGPRKLVRANIHAAMPELPQSEVKRIARSSFDHMFWNLLEYIWCLGSEKRIRRCCYVEEKILSQLQKMAKEEHRVIFVNPHLGSWEISGLMVPFYTGLQLAAIAKPIRNPYLNRFFNTGNRESVQGVKVIFSKGAVRAALQALKNGWSIGTLNDQNTRVRDGGVFVNFFGLPVPGSTAPAMLKSYCDQKGIPCTIFCACSLRNKEGKLVGNAWPLEKPFAEYSSHAEVLQELLSKTESLIRQAPEQYLWMYRRFQYIPEEATSEQISRYPWYALRPGKNFYRKVKNSSIESENGETGA